MGAQLIRDNPQRGQSEQADYLLSSATRPVKSGAEREALLTQRTLTELGEFGAALDLIGPILNSPTALAEPVEECADTIEAMLWRMYHRCYGSVSIEDIEEMVWKKLHQKRELKGGHLNGLVLEI